MRIIKLENASYEINLLKTVSPVVFAGSAVSIWEPTGLADGMSVTKSLCEIIFEGLKLNHDEKEILNALTLGKWEQKTDSTWVKKYDGIPFEHLFDLCPNGRKAGKLLSQIYDCSISNSVHQSISKAFSEDKVSHIITTNYDKCFEDAFSKLTPFHFETVDEEIQYINSDKESKYYFKVHGTADATKENLIFTLRDEGLLPRWKRELLKKLLSDKVCLFIGYSGLDFDLCPLIEKIPNIKILWIDKNPSPQTINAKTLLNNTKGIHIEGDMRKFISQWFGIDCQPNIKRTTIRASEIRGFFSDEEIEIWRMAILNAIGLPAFVSKAALESKGNVDKKIILWHEARADFNAGKYKKASETFNLISEKYANEGRFKSESDTLLDASDSYRAGGYFINAWVKLYKGKRVTKDYNKAKYLLKKSMIISNIFDGLARFGLIAFFLKYWLKRNLRKCANTSLEKGSQLDFQQAGLIAKRTNILLNELEKGDFYSPPEANEGYKHIGYYLAEIMTFCDEIKNLDYKNLSSEEKNETLKQMNIHIKNCEITGQTSNLWKLLAVKKNFLEKTKLGEFKEQEKLDLALQFCEYSRIMRFQQAKKFGLN
jgi:hypothetical protein